MCSKFIMLCASVKCLFDLPWLLKNGLDYRILLEEPQQFEAVEDSLSVSLPLSIYLSTYLSIHPFIYTYAQTSISLDSFLAKCDFNGLYFWNHFLMDSKKVSSSELFNMVVIRKHKLFIEKVQLVHFQ